MNFECIVNRSDRMKATTAVILSPISLRRKEGDLMGEHSRFREGEKSPKNAVYMEIGESGASVQNPMIIELSRGEKFPATRNKNRVWTQK
jgi:hypothetical protein